MATLPPHGSVAVAAAPAVRARISDSANPVATRLANSRAGDLAAEPMITWAILTGEYPPAPGGVSDYTRLVAQGLAAAGDRVHVFAPAGAMPTDPVGSNEAESNISVHWLERGFAPRSLAAVERELQRLPRDTRLLVQYVPHAFGCRAMNIAFVAWLASRRRQPLDIMFHEVAYPLSARQRLR